MLVSTWRSSLSRASAARGLASSTSRSCSCVSASDGSPDISKAFLILSSGSLLLVISLMKFSLLIFPYTPLVLLNESCRFDSISFKALLVAMILCASIRTTARSTWSYISRSGANITLVKRRLCSTASGESPTTSLYWTVLLFKL